jgi:hypothetical protein
MDNSPSSNNPAPGTPAPTPAPASVSGSSHIAPPGLSGSAPELSQLQSQVESLRSLVGSLLIFVIVVSGTLNIYFWRQYRVSKADLEAIRPQAAMMISQYTTNSGPAIDDLLRRIQEYGRTHPDFAPIIMKYQLNQTPTGAPPAKAAAPAPTPAATPGAPKK